MSWQQMGSGPVRPRRPVSRDRVVVHSEDPAFWLVLRQGAPELASAWIPTHSARECLVAIEDPRVRVVVLDGSVRATPADQLLRLIHQIRPGLPVIFGFDLPDEERERALREAGILYYGDRSQMRDMIEVIRRALPPQRRIHPHREELREGHRDS